MKRKKNPQVGIIMGSDSDFPAMAEACSLLDDFSVEYQVDVVSAHRTPRFMMIYAERARKKGLKLIIAGAGGAAHLPGMVASLTDLPVIGVPLNRTALQGHDALYSVVQMPKGVPVATVAIDNSYNAALLALRILSTHSGNEAIKIQKKLQKFQLEMKKKVMRAKIQSVKK